MTPEQQSGSQDVRAFLRSLWRWKFLVLALLIVVPLASYALESRKAPLYSSSALVLPRTVTIDASLFPNPPATESILTIARLVKTRTIANAAGRRMRPPEPGSAIGGLIPAAPATDTGFLTLTATTPDPQRSADVANAFARAISSNRNALTTGQIDLAVASLRRQRAALPARDPQRSQLNEQIQKLRT